MARPRLGSAAKATVGSVRLKPAEAAELQRDFGADTVSEALRALVNAHFDAKKKAEPAA
jgi:hypothetical protein